MKTVTIARYVANSMLLLLLPAWNCSLHVNTTAHVSSFFVLPSLLLSVGLLL